MEDIKRSHEKFSGAKQLKSKRETADWLDRASETGKQSMNLRESKEKVTDTKSREKTDWGRGGEKPAGTIELQQMRYHPCT